ncbi:MAG: aromatic ring-hydroxylating oxygenase subunit alpha [Pseudomonadales bacterium]
MSSTSKGGNPQSDPVNPGCPGPTYQEIVLSDRVRGADGGVPEVLAPVTNGSVDLSDIPFDRYISEDYFDREMQQVWPKVWQFACREEQVAEVGDYLVYDVGHFSIIVLRSASGLRAYHNSCLHRGTKLKPSASAGWTNDGIHCPFHGWSWNLDGKLQEVPCAWEFEHLDYSANSLPEAQVSVWNSLVFINMDLDAEPLLNYLEVMPEHFKNWWGFEEWFTRVHVQKVLSCNWKTAQEAFMEAYHTPVVHPEMTQVVGDWNMQHDIFGPHTSRDLCPMAVSSPSKDHGLSQQQLLEGRLTRSVHDTSAESIPEGQTARSILAERTREDFLGQYGKDLSHLSDAELIDSLKYNVFPNLFVYGGPGSAQIHQVRPNGNDPHSCLFDIYLLQPVSKDQPRPEPANLVQITEADSYKDVPGIKEMSGAVLDQDTQILRWQHEGMRASRKGAETLSRYQESRIRHLHATLDRYVGAAD